MSKNNLNYSVYVHTNKINGKKYVGQSSNIIERWKNGGKNYFSSTKFHRAIQKYGWENFTHEILYENLNKEAANKIERDLIKKYDSINNGYNIQEGGYTSLTKESLDKMSKSLKQGYIDHPERKKRISEIQESKFEHLSDCAEQIVKHGKKLMHCLSELESKSGEHYMERYGKRRRGGMRDSDYDDEDYPRYY